MKKLPIREDIAFSEIQNQHYASFIPQLEKELSNFFENIPYVKEYYLVFGEANPPWTECLSERQSYTAPLKLLMKAEDSEQEYVFNIPLLTPRGTFVIEGQERIAKRILRATDIGKTKKERKHLSDAEKTRDLRSYDIVVVDFYRIFIKFILKIFEKAIRSQQPEKGRKINKRSYGEFFPYFPRYTDLYLKIFNSQTSIEQFPFLDSTNPLSEVEHMRKLTFTRGERTKDGRDIHPTHYGRLCVVETPESEKIGMRLHLAHKARIENGKIITPLKNILTGRIVDSTPDMDQFIVDSLTELKGDILARGAEDGQDKDASEIKYTDAFDDQLFGYAALQVPFIQHNDPARSLMGAKNLKQAVPLREPEIPIVKTGYEETVAEISDRMIRAEKGGRIVKVNAHEIVIATENEEKRYSYIKGVPSVLSKTAFFQKALVRENDTVEAGQTIAEGAGIKDGALALGVNALVAYMPFFGYNIDDSIVVSQRLADKLTSIHIEEFEINIQEGYIPTLESLLVIEGSTLEKVKGSMPRIAVVKRMVNRKSEEVSVFAKEEMLGGVIQKIVPESEKGRIAIWLRKEKRLEVGDKLMGRHGNKGIVSRILPVDDMPCFEVEMNGKKEIRHIDIILNPHSVIGRMNLGQIFETHFGWIAKEHPTEDIRHKAFMMGKPFTNINLSILAQWFKQSGLDSKGKVTVKFAAGNKTRNPVVVGYQYIVKLNHLASGKLSVRGETGPISYVTDIPLSGKKHKGGQRIGEMEVWALMAHGAHKILEDMLGHKSNAHKLAGNAISVSESLKVLIYYLRGIGIAFEVFDAKGSRIEPEDFDNTNKKEIKHYTIRWAEECDLTNWGRNWGTSLKEHFENQNIGYKNGPKNILKVSDLMPTNKEQMGYMELAESVVLCERDVKHLPVIPMRCRPRSDSKLNMRYKRIFLANNELQRLKDEGKAGTEDYIKKKKSLLKQVKKLEVELSGLIKGKRGIIRKAILGKRVNLSARAVIVPDPTIPADSALIPLKIMSELGIEETQEVLLSRQPTLHIHNIQAFNATPHSNNAIAINPLIRKGFNADFDGDTMAIYATNKTIPDGMHVAENIFLAANGKINLDFSQDIAAGIYYAFQTEKGKAEIEGLIGDVKIFDASKYTTLKNKDISDIIYKYYLKCNDRTKTLRLAEQIADFGLKWATFAGLTFGIFDLQEIALTEKDKRDLNYHTKATEDFLECKIEDEKIFSNPISIMMLSGAKGDIKQLRQMAGIKGVVERLGGKSTSASINASYLEGLKPTEYYLACFGARKSLGDKKLMTPQCGYLTRRLVFSALDMKINSYDCGTDEGVSLDIALSLGRTLLKDVSVNDDAISRNTVIDERMLDSFKKAGISNIEVRSPLMCRSDNGLCIKCYGWHLSKKKETQKGFAAGIMSAEVIGERATQDAMRTYHKGEATATIKDFKDIECIFDNAVNPRTKKKAAEDIHSAYDAFKLAYTLFKIYEKNVDIKHYEVILRALVADNEFKGTKGVIAGKGILYKASFEGAVDVFKAYAKQQEEKEFSPSTVLERLFN